MGPWHLTEANRHMRWKSQAWSLSQLLFFISKKHLWILNVKIIIKLSNLASMFSKRIKKGTFQSQVSVGDIPEQDWGEEGAT